jgi:hypothetical protein
MRVEPNRFRGYAGAARAVELAGDKEKARAYYAKLLELADKGDGDRAVLKTARDIVGTK